MKILRKSQTRCAVLFKVSVLLLCTVVLQGCSVRKITNRTAETPTVSIDLTDTAPCDTSEDEVKETSYLDSPVVRIESDSTEVESVLDTAVQPNEETAEVTADETFPAETSTEVTETVYEYDPEETYATTDANTETEISAPSVTEKRIRTRSIPDFGYLLYTPSDPEDDMPLIVYLHGGSGKGDDLSLITDADGFPAYLKDGKLGNVRAYVLIPQLPSDMKGWSDAVPALVSLIKVTAADCGIDLSRVSLTGHSMGGTGVWSVAAALPDMFSRIAPLSGSVRNTPETIELLKNIPVRAFVGDADTIVPPESSETMVAALKEAGCDAEITIFPDADHFSVPSLTYLDKDNSLIDWLIGK